MRPAVIEHAERMETRLKENDHKGGWLTCSFEYLLERLREEVDELDTALNGYDLDDDPVIEAADVANFAMMIADKYVRRKQRSG